MKDLPKRTTSAIIFASIVLGLTYYSFYSFLLMWLIVILIGLVELQQLFHLAQFKIQPLFLWLKMILSILLILYACFSDAIMFNHIQYAVWILLIGIVCIEFLVRNDFSEAIAELLIELYLMMFFISVLDVFYFMHTQYNYRYVFVVIWMIWANDTFAYFVGSMIGKHKLMPDVSPNKSIEGFIGGIVFCVLTGVLSKIYFLQDDTQWLMSDIIFIALILSVVGTAGDLVESRLKRLAGTKDSGNIIPGHGGILDRFDAWFLSIPAVDLYFHLKYFVIS